VHDRSASYRAAVFVKKRQSTAYRAGLITLTVPPKFRSLLCVIA